MRYREELAGSGNLGEHPSHNVVELTVWLTLAIGILFLFAGLKSGQLWLKFWGALTLVACAAYFGRSWIF